MGTSLEKHGDSVTEIGGSHGGAVKTEDLSPFLVPGSTGACPSSAVHSSGLSTMARLCFLGACRIGILIFASLLHDGCAALGLWEAQLRDHYKEYIDPAGLAEKTVTPSRKELREIQRQIATALAKQELSVVKAQLFMLDGLASELAAKAQRSRPVLVEATNTGHK